MNNDKRTKEYFEKWQNLKLSDSSRARMEENLLQYARFHTVKEDVRAAGEGRSREQVPQRTSFFSKFNRSTMPVLAIAAVLVISGGTSFAAQGSLPGDFLYPVKIGINENVRGALAISDEAEARLQAELLTERVEEASALKAEGRLEGELAAMLQKDIETRARLAMSVEAETNTRTKTSADAYSHSSVRLALERFNALIGTDSRLAITVNDGTSTLALEATEESDARTFADASDTESQTNADSSMSTMLMLEPVAVDVLLKDSEMRIEGLIEVIADHESEIKTDVRAELNASLKEADALVAKAKTQSEAEARASLDTAAELAGEVEATLSTLGQIEINPETGAIIDIDFSITPAPPEEPVLVNSPIDIEVEEGLRLETQSSAQSSDGRASVNIKQNIDAKSSTEVLIVE